jgi:hypothetical protein
MCQLAYHSTITNRNEYLVIILPACPLKRLGALLSNTLNCKGRNMAQFMLLFAEKLFVLPFVAKHGTHFFSKF